MRTFSDRRADSASSQSNPMRSSGEPAFFAGRRISGFGKPAPAEQASSQRGPAPMPHGVDMLAAVTGRSAPAVQRQGEGGVGGAPGAPASVHAAIGRGGESLPGGIRSRFEERMGTGFGHVRIHKDSTAAESAREVSARAYTVGNHVVFGAGMFRPESVDGERLIAHELTHVVQQRGASAGPVQRSALPVAESGSFLEREADRVADRVVGREPIGPVSAAGQWLQKDDDDKDDRDGGTPTIEATVKQFPPPGSPLEQGASAVLVQLHGDELNSLATAAQMVRDYNVIVIYLERTGKDRREVSVKGGSVRTIDPNRIFTPAGVKAEVGVDENAAGNKGATARAVANFGRSIYTMIETARTASSPSDPLPVIGLHNNGPGALAIDTVEDYKIIPAENPDPKTGRMTKLKSMVTSGPFIDRDNFVLATRVKDKQMLEGIFNMVIQSTTSTDDGSLSIRIIRELVGDGSDEEKINSDAQYYNVEAEGKGVPTPAKFGVNRDMVARLLGLLNVAQRDRAQRARVEEAIRRNVPGGSVAEYPLLKRMLDMLPALNQR